MTQKGLKWELKGQNLILLPEKAIYWEEEKALIVADLHIGKVGHFRKSGIAIPRSLEQEDLARLSDLIDQLKPEKLIFLGDLFHSEHNSDWNWVELWRGLFKDIRIILIRGNHDVLHDDYYLQADFELYHSLLLQPFLFIHEPTLADALPPDSVYILSGHIHPAVKLKGKGRQSALLSCFYFGPTQGILPAFGRFTGRYCIKISEQDAAFIVTKDNIIRL